MKRLYNTRTVSQPSFGNEKAALKRRPSITNEVEIPKAITRADLEKLPMVPRFIKVVKSLEVADGDKVYLDCKISGNPLPTIYWFKDGQPITCPSNKRWTETTSEGCHALIIKYAKVSDRGSYRCTIENRLGKASCVCLLNVHQKSQIISKTKNLNGSAINILRQSSEKSLFEKTSKNSPRNSLRTSSTPIEDRKVGVIRRSLNIVDTSSVRRSSFESTTSYITSSAYAPSTDSEGYSSSKSQLNDSFEISSSVTSSSSTIMSARIQRSPQFTLKPQSQVVEEGKSMNFRCKLSGNPHPAVEWYKGSAKLRSSDRINIQTTPEGQSSLELQDLTALDAGKYRCVAHNSAGKASCSVELVLTACENSESEMSRERAPSFSQVLKPSDVKSGDRVRFECKIEGRPKPTVQWKKDGNPVSASSRVRIMEVYGTHSLIISRTELTDGGKYSITASNHIGNDSCSAQLHVQDMSASRGSSNSQLSGTYSSNRSSPNASNLSSPSRSPKLKRAAQSRLVSGSVESWSAGIKPAGGGKIGGGPPPRRRGPGFILRPRPQTIAVGESLCLKCTLLGHPKPTVTWEKDGDLVDDEKTDGHIHTRNDNNDYYLEIDECGTGDAGKYGVTARNSLGKQTAAVDVVITGSGGGKSTPSQRVTSSKPTTNHQVTVNNRNDNNNAQIRHNGSHSMAAEEEKKTSRVQELIIPANLKPDDSKDSPTSSISSTISSHSRVSTSSSRHDLEAEDTVETHKTSAKSSWSKRHYVAPTFTRRLSSTQVLEGEELLLQCEVSGDPDPDLSWLRNGRELGIDEDEVFTSFRNGIARLRLRDLQAQHAGEYVCKARNEGGIVQCSSRVTIKAKPVHTLPRFSKRPSDQRLTEGDKMTLETEVSGSPSPEIVWSLDGEEVAIGESTYHGNIAKLEIGKITVAYSGQYMCSALNASGEDSVACRVRVKQKKNDIPPEFTAPLSDLTTTDGDDVCLRCMVTGIPEPKVQWMFNDEVLDAEEGLEITYQDGVAALTLEQATEDDNGTYTCLAVNGEGKATTSCQVTITALPKPEKKAPTSPPKFANLFDEYTRTQEGDVLTLECDVTGNPCPTVTWSINDQAVENAKVSYQDGKASITFDSVTSSHGGHIKCDIQNSAGKASHQSRIYVRSKRVAPTFLSNLPDVVNVGEGEEASFQCKVTGHPQPRVTWTRDGRSLSVLSTDTSYEDGVAMVRIRKAGHRDGGKYICSARNLSGEAESVCIVNVTSEPKTKPKPVIKKEEPTLIAPQFTETLNDVTLDDWQDLKLQCRVTGTPVPKISWILDGQKMDGEDGDASFENGVAKLLVEDVMQEDSGEYRCVATNPAGKAETFCRVTVNAPVKKPEPKKEPKEVVPKHKEPSFPILLEDTTIKEGQDIVLKCQIVGTPRPNITWLLDGEEIQDADIKYEKDGNITLLLTEALPEDEGVYTCIAENPLKRVMCSCKVSIDVPPKPLKKKQTHHIPPAVKKIESTPQPEKREAQPKIVETDSAPVSPPRPKQEELVKPYFTERMQDQIVPDGSTNFKLYCQVAGTPEPTAKWYFEDQEMEADGDFEFISKGDERILKFAEVFPEDSGTYTCVISNSVGETRTQCNIKVEEIDGDAPTFMLKPKPCNVEMGEKAMFTCRVDGEPVPTVRWMFCNKPIEDSRMVVTKGNADNNYTHSLEIAQALPQDAGRYSVTCSNLLGDITCTVSLIVGGGKKQETRKDFRDVLKKSAKPSLKSQSSTEEQVDFRSVLRTASTDKDLGARTLSSSGSEDPCDDPTIAYKEALSSSVRTKHMTEEVRKLKKAEQKDFRSETLTRKVETKVTTQDALRVKGSEQLDFRDEALKTKVKTKVLGQDDYKVMSPEQKDFRDVAIKSKVVTKAYREEVVKAQKAEQVDFRNVLSPTKKDTEDKSKNSSESGTLLIAELPKAKWKKDNVDNTTVATRRARHRGAAPEKRMEQNGEEKENEEEEEEEEEEKFSPPVFTQPMKDISTKDGEPFELICHVTGDPEPEVKWFLEEEEVKAEADITITKEGSECRLSIAESFPEDQGKYICLAKNEHGKVTCHSYVTVITEEPEQSKSSVNYTTKKNIPSLSSIVPASIKNGPRDSTVIRGNPISICCELSGTQPLKVVWRKGRDQISHSHQCNIETSKSFSALTIKKSERDDSGCYTLQVTNKGGVDQFSVSVKVVDVPDPPGKPFAEIKDGVVVVSWYGSGYDGGSQIKSYLLESTKLKGNSVAGRKFWKEVATTNSTSYTIKDLEANAFYLFRVSAENEYGMGRPGSFSNVLQNIPVIENGADTTDDESEGEFVQYEPVQIRQNEKFSTRYEIKDKLGQGRFGKVHRVVDRKSGKQYAAKIMRALKAKDREAVSLEIEIMNALRHPKLVQLIDAYNHGREIHMVMDLVAGGELFERVIDEDFELTEAACIKYMRQICSGVQFMHDKMIVHLDLKPENIMCINKTGTKIKIIDFGLARKFNPNEPIKVMFGTPEFVAPEVINYDVIGFQTDMWSVGVICYILLSGLSPFSGDADTETLSNITAVLWDFDDEAFDQISEEAKDFISKLLVKSMKNRYTVNKALQHNWLNNDTNKMSKSKLNTKNLKRFLARRKWQKTGNAVRALSRLTSLARLTTSNAGGQPRESGFLSSLRAELVREKESKNEPSKTKPEFIQKFDDIEVIEGSAAKFQCTVTGVPDPEIIWYKDGKPIKESRHYRISYTEDDVCTLLITEATEMDDAEYMCRAINSEGEVELNAELIVICSANFSSTSLSSPSSPSQISSSEQLSFPFVNNIFVKTDVKEWIRIGQTSVFIFTMPYKILENKNKNLEEISFIKWFKFDQNTQDFKIIQNVKNLQMKTMFSENEAEIISYLVINDTSLVDSGIYRCKGTLSGLEYKTTYELSLLEEHAIYKKTKCMPPRFLKVPKAQNVAEGAEAVLKCTVLGKPAPIIYWYIYGTRLYQGDRHRFKEDETTASLEVLQTRWYDSGKYECIAVSPLGEARCSVDLSVQPPDHQEVEFEGAPMFLRRTQAKVMKMGEAVMFKCTVAGTPQPKVYWKKGDTVLSAKDSQRYRITQNQGGGHSFAITKTRLNDRGKYTCIAENEKGVALCAAFLTLGKLTNLEEPSLCYDVLPLAPVFVTRPFSATVRAGYSVAFQCTVHGVPVPKLTWFTDNGKPILQGQRYVIEDMHSHHVLRIKDTRLTDCGNYFCTASNTTGEATCSVRLEVKRARKFEHPSIKFGAEARDACLLNNVGNDKIQQVRAVERKLSITKAITLNEGKNAKISLTVKGIPKPEVSWYHAGQKITTGNRFRLSIVGDVYQLRIARVSKHDEGMYSILACNEGGLFTTILQVTIKDMPKPLVFSEFPAKSLAAHEGADAIIQCKLTEQVKDKPATWSKDNQDLTQEKEKYEVLSIGTLQQLTIKKVSADDEGDYTCKVLDTEATSKLIVKQPTSQQRRDSLLSKQVLPEIETFKKDKTILRPKNEILNAHVQVISPPVPQEMEVPETGTLILQHTLSEVVEGCYWTLRGTKLVPTERCKINVHGVKHSLMFADVGCADAGDILFHVPQSTINIPTQLSVQALPLTPPIPSVRISGDFKITLSWENIDKNNVDYVVELFSEKDNIWKEHARVSSLREKLEIKKLQEGDSYQFRLKSLNKVGFCKQPSEPSQVVTIPIKTKIVRGLKDIEIDEGETARFEVQLNLSTSKGDWFLNGLKLIERGENCQIISSGNVHSLIMKNLNKNGSAAVKFVAEDSQDSSSAQLIVKGKTLTVVEELQDVTVTENSEATFTVALSKQVNKLGKWYHKHNELVQSHDVIIEKRNQYQILQLKNIKSTASGEIRFAMPGKTPLSSSCQLTVLSWFETEPFQKITCTLPETTLSKIGDDVTITVKLSSDKKCHSKWDHKGNPIPPKSKKYKIKQKNDEIRLTIKDITLEDEGVVQCTVDKNKVTTQLHVEDTLPKMNNVSENISVLEEETNIQNTSEQVKEPMLEEQKQTECLVTKPLPPIPSVTFIGGQAKKVMSCKEGDLNFVLNAHISDIDTEVVWLKDGIEINENDTNIKILKEGAERKLVFDKVNSNLSGNYQCALVLNSDIFTSFVLSVQEQLHTFTKPLPKQLNLIEGNELKLNVEVEPEHCDVKWMKDGLVLQQDKRIKMSLNTGLSRELVITNVSCEDRGKYSCETLHDSVSALVTIKEPVVEIVKGLQDCICKNEDTVTFEISLSRKPRGNPVWKLNDKILFVNGNCQISVSGNTYNVTLRDLKVKDSGKIIFVADNVNVEANLTVKAPLANFIKKLKDTTIEERNQCVLTCEVGADNANVQWSKGTTKLLSIPGKCVISREGRICKLKILETCLDDAAFYQCESDCDVTRCKLNITKLEVKVSEELNNVVAVVGEVASFSIMLSHSDINVKWTRNGKVIKEQLNKCEILTKGCWHALHMRKLSIADSGEIQVLVEDKVLDHADLYVKKPPVRFVKEIRDLVVDLKDSAQFTCEVSDHEAEVTWYRNDAELSKSDQNIEISSKGITRTLFISRVVTHHEARYSCETDEGCKTSAELFVKVPLLHVTEPLTDVRKYVNDEAEFRFKFSQCDVEGDWLMDSEILIPSTTVSIIDDQCEKTLRLHDVTQTSVIAYRTGETVMTSCLLEVRERPVGIERRLSDMTVREGSDVKFECFFSKPDLEVAWYMDDEEVFESEKFNMESEGCKQTLKVVDARYDDEANYSCRYRNRRTSAELTVLEPKIDVQRPLSDVEELEGEVIELECVLSLPVVAVTWCKDGRTILGPDAYVNKIDDCVKHTLKLSDVSKACSGTYSLTYSYKTLTNSEVRVKRQPIIFTTPLKDVTGRDDDNKLILTCAISKPTRDVIWLCEDEKLENSSDFVIENNDLIQSLTIILPESEDSAIYHCVIPNQSETSCFVTIERWLLSLRETLPSEETFVEGEPADLNCQFSMKVESHEVTWYIDDVLVDDVTCSDMEVVTRGAFSTLDFENISREWNEKEITVKCRNVESSCKISVIHVPDQPCELNLIDESTDVRLIWGKPLVPGGSPLIGYVIQAKTEKDWDDVACEIITDDDLTMMTCISSFQPEIKHWLRVAAVSDLGIGKYAEFPENFTPELPLYFETELKCVEITEGETLELWCELNRSISDKACWTVDHVTITSEEERLTLYEYDRTREIVIKKATVHDAGTYRCSVGDITSQCDVIIKILPFSFLQTLSDITALVGKDVFISCIVSKECSLVQWFRNDVLIRESPKFHFTEKGGIKNLLVRSCKEYDSGTYRCNVTSFRGDVITTTGKFEFLAEDSMSSSDGENWKSKKCFKGNTEIKKDIEKIKDNKTVLNTLQNIEDQEDKEEVLSDIEIIKKNQETVEKFKIVKEKCIANINDDVEDFTSNKTTNDPNSTNTEMDISDAVSNLALTDKISNKSLDFESEYIPEEFDQAYDQEQIEISKFPIPQICYSSDVEVYELKQADEIRQEESILRKLEENLDIDETVKVDKMKQRLNLSISSVDECHPVKAECWEVFIDSANENVDVPETTLINEHCLNKDILQSEQIDESTTPGYKNSQQNDNLNNQIKDEISADTFIQDTFTKNKNFMSAMGQDIVIIEECSLEEETMISEQVISENVNALALCPPKDRVVSEFNESGIFSQDRTTYNSSFGDLNFDLQINDNTALEVFEDEASPTYTPESNLTLKQLDQESTNQNEETLMLNTSETIHLTTEKDNAGNASSYDIEMNLTKVAASEGIIELLHYDEDEMSYNRVDLNIDSINTSQNITIAYQSPMEETLEHDKEGSDYFNPEKEEDKESILNLDNKNEITCENLNLQENEKTSVVTKDSQTLEMEICDDENPAVIQDNYCKNSESSNNSSPDSSLKNKRMSMISSLSDSYETATESIDEEFFMSANSQTSTINHLLEHKVEETDIEQILDNFTNVLLEPNKSSENSACTVSSFNSGVNLPDVIEEESNESNNSIKEYNNCNEVGLNISDFNNKDNEVSDQLKSNEDLLDQTLSDLNDEILKFENQSLFDVNKGSVLPVTPTCVIKPMETTINETVTTIVVDAKTGETITTCNRTLQLSSPLYCQPLDCEIESENEDRDLQLPHETTDDKMARLFGIEPTFVRAESFEDDNSEKLNLENQKFLHQESSEVTQTVSLNLNEVDNIISTCMEALRDIEENSEKEIGNVSRMTLNEGLSPGFTQGLHNQHSVVGNTVIFSCIVAAYPEPSVSWRKEGSMEEVMVLSYSTENMELQCNPLDAQKTECSLKIHRVTKSDAALYSCHVTNKFGQSACSAVLQVHEDNSDDELELISTDHTDADKAIATGIKNIHSDATPTISDSYVTDDDVSIYVPQPSENSYAWSIQPPEPGCGAEQWDQEKPLNKDGPKSIISSTQAKPLKIHVIESIVIRETYSTSSCSTQDESELSDSSCSLYSQVERKSRNKYHPVLIKRTSSRPSTSMGFSSDSDCELESLKSSVKAPEIYYAVTSSEGMGFDSATLRLKCGQPVEVLDSSSSREWLVRTKPTKDQPIKMGFVDPVLLSQRLFTPSPVPSSAEKISPRSRPAAFNFPLCTELPKINVDQPKIEFPKTVMNFEKSYSSLLTVPTNLETGNLDEKRRLLIQNLIKEEENYVIILRKACHVIKHVQELPPAVDLNSQQLFGDLEEIEQFHTSLMLVELNKCLANPLLLPHVFLKLGHWFEQLHFTHVINTFDSIHLAVENKDVASGLAELSRIGDVTMEDVAQKPLQQLTLYQYYLKKLMRYEENNDGIIKVSREAVRMLYDVPHLAKTTRLWQKMNTPPNINLNNSGKLLKEGVVLISGSSDFFNKTKSQRRIFLLENCLVIAKYDKTSDMSKFEKKYSLSDFDIVCEPSETESKVFLLKSDNHKGAPWCLYLKCQTFGSKQAWCREIINALQHNTSLKENSIFDHYLSDVGGKTGGEIMLYCYVTPCAAVKWSKDGVILKSLGRVSMVTRTDGFCGLFISDVTKDDAGTYQCSIGDDDVVTSSVVTIS